MSDSAVGLASHADVLDTAGATRRVLGNGALYLRMLRRFVHDHPSGSHAIGDAFASADLALAHRLAHSLKGSAGMLGAQRLQVCAATLEQQLRMSGFGAARPALEQLELALADAVVAAARVLDGKPAGAPDQHNGAATPPAFATREAAEASLQQLAALLDLGDGAAIEAIDRMGAACRTLLGAAAYSEVMLAMHAFDFEAALRAIRKAAPDIVQVQ